MRLVFILIVSITAVSSEFTLTHCNYCTSVSCTPTITPAEDFSAQRDRIQLEHAILGWGTAEDVLINILTARSDNQRVQIAENYIMTGSTLTDDISGDTRGKFLGILMALTKPLPLFYAEELYHAVVNNRYLTIIEIMTSLPGCAIREISMLYRLMYGVSLYRDISKHTRFKFRTLLLELAKGERDEHEEINMDQVRKDADILINSGVNGWIAVRTPFIEILTKRSFPQLRATFEAYDVVRRAKDTKYISIIKDVDNLFSGKVKDTFLAMIRNVINQPMYFAEELEEALSKFAMRTDSQKVIRIIRGRCEIDLADIKKAYLEIYRRPLINKVKEETHTHFQDTLVGILKEK